MTEQQFVKTEKKKQPGVILNDRFVHRDSIIPLEHWQISDDPDELIAKLAEHFTLDYAEFFSVTASANCTNTTNDDTPRFHESKRDGLQIPKEGKDGTGN